MAQVTLEQLTEDVWVVSLLGEHDISMVDALRDRLAEAFTHDPRLIIDLTEATFVDSTVLGVLFAQRQVRRSRWSSRPQARSTAPWRWPGSRRRSSRPTPAATRCWRMAGGCPPNAARSQRLPAAGVGQGRRHCLARWGRGRAEPGRLLHSGGGFISRRQIWLRTRKAASRVRNNGPRPTDRRRRLPRPARSTANPKIRRRPRTSTATLRHLFDLADWHPRHVTPVGCRRWDSNPHEVSPTGF
jgi:hypothetical protein